MSEPLFTEGPWIVDKYAGEDGTCVVLDSKRDIVAGPTEYRRYDSCTIVTGIAIDDAHLIAAAPDMYAKLVEVAHVLRAVNVSILADDIDNLLKKARGES